MVHYHRERTDHWVRLNDPGHWEDTETDSICWEPGHPGHDYEDNCYGEPGAKYFNWLHADWDQDGLGEVAGSPAGGPDCGDKGDPWYEGPYTAGPAWPGESCVVSGVRRERDPLGTECYAQETGSDAAATAIDHATRESAAVVVAGTPEVAQELVITATNTFVCTDVTCPVTTVPTTVIQAPAAAALASTGGPAFSYLLLDLLMFAAGTVILGRRRGARRSRPMPR